MNQIQFAHPQFLFLLALVPLLLFWHFRRGKRKNAELQLSTLAGFQKSGGGWRSRLEPILLALRVLAVIGLVIAIARPQSTSSYEKVNTEGIDIVLATDISGSMLAEDFHPNRIEAAKAVAKEFVKNRPDDRIGLVVFAGESFTQCPVTIDHDVLDRLIDQLKSGMVDDGTAIGLGLATAVSRLKDSKAKSRVILLLTDGVNNQGFIDPLTAAGIAHTYGIRVYTIGIGTKGTAPYPVQTPMGIRYQNMPVEIDEEVLKKIASETGGKYFRATSNEKLHEIYREIDQMEKTKIEVTEFRKRKEEYLQFGFPAGILFVLEIFLAQTVFRRIP
jgi:Ca-activated chloride channel family protein